MTGLYKYTIIWKLQISTKMMCTNTIRLQSIIENKAKKSGNSIEATAAAMKSTIPAARFAEANEVANAIAFLASPCCCLH